MDIDKEKEEKIQGIDPLGISEECNFPSTMIGKNYSPYFPEDSDSKSDPNRILDYPDLDFLF